MTPDAPSPLFNRIVLQKFAIACALIPLIAAIFTALVVSAFSLPNTPIEKNLTKRPDLLEQRRANNGRVIDADTECIGLSVALFQSPDRQSTSAFERAIRAESLYGCNGLQQWLSKGGQPPSFEYFRYWHGHAVLTRPILSVIAYNDLRGHLFHLSAGLLGVLVWRIGRDFSPAAGLAFLLPFIVLNAMGYWVVATKAVTWFLAMGAAIYLSRRPTSPTPPVLTFFIIGTLTAFFDFLTAPAFIFSMAALTYMLYAPQTPDWQRPIQQVLILGGFWALGYAGLWGMKFIIAAFTLDTPVWPTIIETIAFRFRGSSEHIDGLWPGMPIYENIAALKSFWGPVAIIGFVILPMATAARRARWARLWRNNPALVAIAAIPIVWLEAMSNHSQIHAAFTHLNFAPAMILAGFILFGANQAYERRAVQQAAQP